MIRVRESIGNGDGSKVKEARGRTNSRGRRRVEKPKWAIGQVTWRNGLNVHDGDTLSYSDKPCLLGRNATTDSLISFVPFSLAHSLTGSFRKDYETRSQDSTSS